MRRRDARDLVDAPVPASLLRMYCQALAVAATAIAGFLLSLYSLQWIGDWWLWIAVSAAALGLGVLSRDRAPLCWPARGWLIGWVAASLRVAGAVINELV